MSYSQFDINAIREDLGFAIAQQEGTLYSLEINFLSDRGDARQRHKSEGSPTPRKHNVFVKVGYSRVMQLADRISRATRGKINSFLSKAKAHKSPEWMLEQSILDMQEDLIQLRHAVARASATQKRTEQQYSQNRSICDPQINLLRSRQEEQLDEQTALVDNLKGQMIALKSKISEAKIEKALLQSEVAAATAYEQLQNTFARLETSNTMHLLQVMEEKLSHREAILEDREMLMQFFEAPCESLVEELRSKLKAWQNQLAADEETSLADEINSKLNQLERKLAEFSILYRRVLDSLQICRSSQNRVLSVLKRLMT